MRIQLVLLSMSAMLIVIIVSVLPTWYLGYTISIFLPKTNPWRANFPTYILWVKNATSTNVLIGILFWAGFILLFTIYKKFGGL